MLRSKLKFITGAKAGMTLTEVLVVCSIFVILFGGIAAFLSASTQYWNSNKVRVELQQELRLAMSRMSADLRQAGPSSIFDVFADGATYSSITFKVPINVTNSIVDWSVNRIQYRLATGADGITRLQRVDGTAVTIIANNIQSLQLWRTVADPNILEVSLTAQKNTIHGRTITNTMNFSVQLRN